MVPWQLLRPEPGPAAGFVSSMKSHGQHLPILFHEFERK